MDKKEFPPTHDRFEKMASFDAKDWLVVLSFAFAFSSMCGVIDLLRENARRCEEEQKENALKATLTKIETKDGKKYFSFDTDNRLQTVEYIGCTPENNGQVPPVEVGKNKSFSEWKKQLQNLKLQRVREQ